LFAYDATAVPNPVFFAPLKFRLFQLVLAKRLLSGCCSEANFKILDANIVE